MADPVVWALRDLFQAFAAKESERRSAQHAQQAQQQAQRGVVNPTPLREALSALPGDLFRIGALRGSGEGRAQGQALRLGEWPPRKEVYACLHACGVNQVDSCGVHSSFTPHQWWTK